MRNYLIIEKRKISAASITYILRKRFNIGAWSGDWIEADSAVANDILLALRWTTPPLPHSALIEFFWIIRWNHNLMDK